ncbi:MAG: DUF4233 domain-containing protein [Nocardioides sp.]|uniref:DUF4233 domain-containing protein n=1 Tax=Nocardioides sp. TaxID=35761 RepID=UPI003F029B96
MNDVSDALPEDTAAEAVEERTVPQKSPRRAMAAAVLALEGITIALSAPVMISVEGVNRSLALWLALGLAAASLVLAGMLRKEWGYWLGYVLQVAVIATGFAVTTMFALGAIFALLWLMADVLGRKIQREREVAWRAYWAENDAADS